MKKALEVTKKQLRKVTTRETPNKGIVAGKIGPSGRYSVTKGTFRASSSEEKAHLPFESELKEKSDTTSKETNTQLGAAETDNSPVENARVTTRKTALGVTRIYNTGALNTPRVTRLKTSQEKQKSHSGSPIEQLEKSIKGETQEIGDNLATSEKKKVLQGEVEQKISDDKKAVPQKGRIRSIEGNLPAAVSSPKLSRHSTRENLSTIGKQGEESEKQEEKPDSHGDSDSEMDLSAIASEPLRHLTKARSQRPSGQRPSAKHQSKISAKEAATASIVRTPSERSINSILSDLEDEENREDSPQLIQEQEPQEKPIADLDSHNDSGIDLFEEKKDSEEKLEITPQIVNLEPEEAVKETPIKKQPSDKNPNVTLAICCLAACCFIAAADKESGMLFLAGITFLIAAIVIEWQTPPPSRELTYPSSSPFIDNKAVAKP